MTKSNTRIGGRRKPGGKTDTRMALGSMNVAGDRVAGLQALFPEAFVEGEVDVERLRQALGAASEDKRERYGLSWAGKSEDFESARNVFIEGENLEVLKLLQRSYYGRVKMIYIDPPYNTGKEFLYPDNYRDSLDQYLRITGQKDEDGARLTTNPETSGRYHSRWLSMMYPRLFLARNLLADDGVIFVSIDDHEVHNLRLLMDEIFGPENFVATIVWQKRTSPDARATLGAAHDSILVYARLLETAKESFRLLPLSEERATAYGNPDNDPRGRWASVDLTGQTGHATPSQFFTIITPAGVSYEPPSDRCWALSKGTFEKLNRDGRIWFGKDGAARPRLKKFLSEHEGNPTWTWWTNEEVGHNQEATKELRSLMGEGPSFDNPKSTRLIGRMLKLITDPDLDHLVLDFFAGSGTTGEAVMRLNAEDGGDRRFLLVQFPEPTGDEKHPTIADIARTRLRNAIGAIKDARKGQEELLASPEGSFAYKAFRLSTSNFKLWNAEEAAKKPEELAEQLKLYADHLLPHRSELDILYELILKSGLSLTADVEKRKAGKAP